jgi:hypothetical protein
MNSLSKGGFDEEEEDDDDDDEADAALADVALANTFVSMTERSAADRRVVASSACIF